MKKLATLPAQAINQSGFLPQGVDALTVRVADKLPRTRRFALLLVGLAALLAASDASAGASNADLTCKATKRASLGLALTGSIPGDFAEFSLRLEDSEGRLEMSDAEDTIQVIDSFKDHVFTLAARTKGGLDVHLFAVPRTVKTAEIEGGFKASFDAVLLVAPKPVKGKLPQTPEFLRDVRMRCEYAYSV